MGRPGIQHGIRDCLAVALDRAVRYRAFDRCGDRVRVSCRSDGHGARLSDKIPRGGIKFTAIKKRLEPLFINREPHVLPERRGRE